MGRLPEVDTKDASEDLLPDLNGEPIIGHWVMQSTTSSEIKKNSYRRCAGYAGRGSGLGPTYKLAADRHFQGSFLGLQYVYLSIFKHEKW